MYFAVEEQQTETVAMHGLHMDALRIRTQIFDLMCFKNRLTPNDLTTQSDIDLLRMYSEAAAGIAKETDVSIEQLKPRIMEYVSDKS